MSLANWCSLLVCFCVLTTYAAPNLPNKLVDQWVAVAKIRTSFAIDQSTSMSSYIRYPAAGQVLKLMEIAIKQLCDLI